MENMLPWAYGPPSAELTLLFLSDTKSKELRVSLQTKVMVIPNIFNPTPQTGKTGSIFFIPTFFFIKKY